MGNLPNTLSQRDAEAWVKDKVQRHCSCDPEVFCKGDFKGMIWLKFSSEDARNFVVQSIGKARLFHGDNAIWINKDRAIEERCQCSFLYAVKKLLVQWSFSKNSLWVDEDGMTLQWNDQMVASTHVIDGQLRIDFGDTWQ
eukprot:898000-Karenia_brevis.AAC.1